MPAASYGISDPRVSMTRFSTSSRSSERLMVLVMSSSSRSLSTIDNASVLGWMLSVEFGMLFALKKTLLIGCPEPGNLDPILYQSLTDIKMAGDLTRRPAGFDHSPQSGVRNKSGGSSSI